jgi:arylsulfatase A
MRCLNRRTFLKMAGLSAATLTTGVLPCAGEKTGGRPNIIFILADDLGYGDVNCLNPDSKIPTPNLDRLAGQGITFTDAHSSSSLCSPTRYGILTGRYSWRSRRQGGALWSFDPPLIEEGRLTVPRYLKDHGYHTACIGKWHLGLNWRDRNGDILENTGAEKGWNVDFSRPLENGPTMRGFDYFFGMDAPNYPPYCYIENDRTIGIPSKDKPRSMFGVPGVMREDWDLYKVLPELEKRAVRYINERADPDRPFFLYFPLTAPHTPIVPNREHVGSSRAGAYGDFVHQVDAIVGNILKALDRNDLTENTLVIFTSDNGSPRRDGTGMEGEHDSVLRYGHNPSHHFSGKKADIWEGGHRVPFLARWPGKIAPGSRSDEVVCTTDFFATCAAIVGNGLPDDAGEDSYNILPLLTGEGRSGALREATVHLGGDGSFSIRQGKWKLEICPGSGGGGTLSPEMAMREKLPMIQLYDLEKDIGEKNNLHDRYPEVVYRLTGLLERYVEDGRSTPGRPQENTGEPDIWRSLEVRNDKFDTSPVDHLAVGKKIRSLNDAPLKFTKDGPDVLIDGKRASALYKDGYWVGVEGEDLHILVDLGRETGVSGVSAGFLEDQAYWIFLPAEIEFALSRDGRRFHSIKSVSPGKTMDTGKRTVRDFSLPLKGETCRYIRMRATGVKVCPEWHKGAGGKAWLFADELIVE